MLDFILAYITPRPPMSVHNKFQPIRSSRLAGYRQHIYIRLSCFIIEDVNCEMFLYEQERINT